MSKVILLKADRTVKVMDFEPGEDKLKFFYKTIDCQLIDIVQAHGLKNKGYCLIVDDEGLFRADMRVNINASLLYGVLEHGEPLVRDVLVAKDKVTERGLESEGLTDEEVEEILNELMSLNLKFLKMIKAQA